MENRNLKFVKSASTILLSASLLTGALMSGAVQADAASKKVKKVTPTTVKVTKSGKLVNKKTGKTIKDTVSYKGKVYKNGKKASGVVGDVFYKNGKKATGISKGIYYQNGKKGTGTYKGIRYSKGAKATGLINGNYYKAGKKSTAVYKNKLYVKGKQNKGLYVYKGKLYDGVSLNTDFEVVKNKLYNGSALNKGLILYKGILYNGTSPNEGLAFYNNKLYNGENENTGLILYEGKLYNGASLNTGVVEKDGIWYNGSAIAVGTITTPDGKTITVDASGKEVINSTLAPSTGGGTSGVISNNNSNSNTGSNKENNSSSEQTDKSEEIVIPTGANSIDDLEKIKEKKELEASTKQAALKAVESGIVEKLKSEVFNGIANEKIDNYTTAVSEFEQAQAAYKEAYEKATNKVTIKSIHTLDAEEVINDSNPIAAETPETTEQVSGTPNNAISENENIENNSPSQESSSSISPEDQVVLDGLKAKMSEAANKLLAAEKDILKNYPGYEDKTMTDFILGVGISHLSDEDKEKIETASKEYNTVQKEVEEAAKNLQSVQEITKKLEVVAADIEKEFVDQLNIDGTYKNSLSIFDPFNKIVEKYRENVWLEFGNMVSIYLSKSGDTDENNEYKMGFGFSLNGQDATNFYSNIDIYRSKDYSVKVTYKDENSEAKRITDTLFKSYDQDYISNSLTSGIIEEATQKVNDLTDSSLKETLTKRVNEAKAQLQAKKLLGEGNLTDAIALFNKDILEFEVSGGNEASTETKINALQNYILQWFNNQVGVVSVEKLEDSTVDNTFKANISYGSEQTDIIFTVRDFEKTSNERIEVLGDSIKSKLTENNLTKIVYNNDGSSNKANIEADVKEVLGEDTSFGYEFNEGPNNSIWIHLYDNSNPSIETTIDFQ